MTEEFEYEAIIGHEEKIDEETGEETFVDIKETRTGTKWKENPEYNPDEEIEYIEDLPQEKSQEAQIDEIIEANSQGDNDSDSKFA